MDAHEYLEKRINDEINACLASGSFPTLSKECRDMIQAYRRDYEYKYNQIGLNIHIAYFLGTFELD